MVRSMVAFFLQGHTALCPLNLLFASGQKEGRPRLASIDCDPAVSCRRQVVKRRSRPLRILRAPPVLMAPLCLPNFTQVYLA
jgi:hypothetical protein